MSSRKIRAALKARGIPFEDVHFSWQPSPEENVPTYTIVLRSNCYDIYGADEWNDFPDLESALEFVNSLTVQTYNE